MPVRSSFCLITRSLSHWLALLLLFTLTTLVSAAEDKTILILGDSLSASYGIPSEKSWVALLAKQLSEKHKPYHVVNASISGETTDGGLRRLGPLLERHKPEIVVIELGGNDGLRGFPLSLIRKNLTRLVEQAQAANARVLLTGIRIPPNYGRKYADGFHQIYQEIAEKTRAYLVDFLLENIAGNPELMQQDRIHPTADAQPIMMKQVWHKLETLLN